MNLDGEWRVAFIKRERPNLDRHCADAGRRRAAGALRLRDLNGTIIGIPKTSKHKDQAWELVKYLTTNDHALARVRQRARQRADDDELARSPELIPDLTFAIFLKIYANPHSSTFPITAAGTAC